ncbi:MAG: pentapeptide repeat-containing protein [Paracoccaceae bacterium]
MTRAKSQAALHNEKPNPTAHLAALAKNCNVIWVTLLSTLLYVVVALASFEDIDFYGFDRSIQLPVINFSVPARNFVVAAPLIVSVLYCYFHYLLASLADQLKGSPKAVRILALEKLSPWLITETRYFSKRVAFREGSEAPAVIPYLFDFFTILLIWGGGIAIITAYWWTAATTRSWWLTSTVLIALFCASAFGLHSARAVWMQCSDKHAAKSLAVVIFSTMCLCVPTYFRTVDPAPWMYQERSVKIWNRENRRLETEVENVPVFADAGTSIYHRLWTLAEINLEGEFLVGKQGTFRSASVEYSDFRREWCKRKEIDDCQNLGRLESDLSTEFIDGQESRFNDWNFPPWHHRGNRKPDLRGANLKGAFIVGLDLSDTSLLGIDLRGATGAWSNLQGSDLRYSELGTADLRFAQLDGSNLSHSNLVITDLQHASLVGVTAHGAYLNQTDLGFVKVIDSDFSGAYMADADLTKATVILTNFSGAEFYGTYFDATALHFSFLDGVSADERGGPLFATSKNDASALRNTDLSHATVFRYADITKIPQQTYAELQNNLSPSEVSNDWSNAFLDGSVKSSEKLWRAMGLNQAPCQWTEKILSDAEFFSRWRGWIESAPFFNPYSWEDIAPPGWRYVPALAPPDDCVWHKGDFSSVPESLSAEEIFRGYHSFRLGR